MESICGLTIDSFEKRKYVQFQRGIYVHESVDLKKRIYHYLSLEYLLHILKNNKFRISNRKNFTDLSEKGKKYDPHKCLLFS